MTLAGYDVHPCADIFPAMHGAEFDALVADIQEHGQREPIVLYDLKILDGRNRARACESLGITPKVADYVGNDPLAFVISLNLRRRHLNESQRAMVAARIANMPSHRPGKSAQICALKSQPEAAGLLSVGTRSTQHARRVLDRGTPDLAAAVDAGEIPVSEAAKIAEEPAEFQREVIEKVRTGAVRNVKHAMRQRVHAEKREVALAESVDGLYSVIYADPPWQYNNSGFDGAPDDHYPTMPTDAICALPVAERLATNAACFLWVTNPHLEDGLRVLRAWGFEYKTNLVWPKDKGTHLGFYAIGYHELVLIGTKGAAAPERENIGKSIIDGARREHSRKPDEMYARIERMYPAGRLLELFSRRAPHSERWTVWGNEPA